MNKLLASLAFVFLAACGAPAEPSPDDGTPQDTSNGDAGPGDAEAHSDTAVTDVGQDSGSADAATDAGPADTGVTADAGPPCGELGQECCGEPGVPGSCDALAPLACVRSTTVASGYECRPCGDSREPCCATPAGYACNGGLTCSSGACQ